MADTILTLSEYKAARGITDNTNDSQLEAIIPMVNSYIEEYCHRQFGLRGLTERNEGVMDHLGRFFFKMNNPPVRSVSAVQVRFIGTDVPLDVDVTRLDLFANDGYAYYSWLFNPSIAVIREEYRHNFYYDVTYSGGRPVPPPVKFAAITIVADTFSYYNTNPVASGQKTPSGELRRVIIGDYAEEYETRNSMFKNQHDTKTGIILTKTVQDLLRPYVKEDQSW